jgi:hypothetical protein
LFPVVESIEGQWKTQEPMAKFVPSKIRIEYCAKLKAKSPIQYEQIRQDLWKTRFVLLRKPLEIQSRWWNIWDVTPIKSPLVTEKSIDNANVL